MNMGPAQAAAVVVAGGAGSRLGAPKAFVSLRGRTLLEWSLEAFHDHALIGSIVAVVPGGEIERAEKICLTRGFRKVARVVEGGRERQDSVLAGLRAVPTHWYKILIHDVARPLFPGPVIELLLHALETYPGAIPAIPISDTIKEIEEGRVLRTLPRSRLVAAQTPQAFRRTEIEQAHARAREEGFMGTDDASLAERSGFPVAIVEGSPENLKITTPADLIIAEALLGQTLSR